MATSDAPPPALIPALAAGMKGILIDRRDRQEFGLKIRRIEELGKIIDNLE